MGNVQLLAAAAKSSSGSSAYLIIILVLFFGVFYFLMIRPQRNRQRQAMQVQNAVVPGQRVRTTAGMYGTVTAVDDGDVVIEVAPGVEIRYLKRAIMDVLTDAPSDGMHGGVMPEDGAYGDGMRTAADPEAAAEEPEPTDEPSASEPDEADAARRGHAAE